MNAIDKNRNRFTTLWAIEDPIDELVHLNKKIESYKNRSKKIINLSLILALFYFSFVIISLVLTIYNLTNILFLSQSFSTFFLFESAIDLIFHLFSLPFSTIVIIFLLQTWKFYEVLVNRIQTINKVWDEETIIETDNTNESTWNPMELNLLILGEMQEHISQVKKQISISLISLFLTSTILLVPAFFHILYGSVFLNLNSIIAVFSPFILLIITIIVAPLIVELNRFITWQYQQFKIIKAVYSNPLPITESDSQDVLSRLKSYLKKDTILNKNEKIGISKPFNIENVIFDMGGKSKHNIVFVRKCNSLVPSSKEIEQFYLDIQQSISKQQIKPEYIRAILLCDWREEEGEIPDQIENDVLSYPIKLRNTSIGDVVTFIQIVMDNGSIYTMFPLIPDNMNG